MRIRDLRKDSRFISATAGYEAVLYAEDVEADYRGLVAIDSTILGPALGGTRLWSYPELEPAVDDVLRLARGMTYKNAVAGLPAGGGKAVIMRPKGAYDRRRLFECHGRFVASFAGTYLTAEDVGTTVADMEIIRSQTQHVTGLASGSGDPSPHTARGVFRAIQAVSEVLGLPASGAAMRVAVQGCGNVGQHLIAQLRGVGATVVAADIDRDRVITMMNEFGVEFAEPNDILFTDVDIVAPCALGAVFHDLSIPRVRARAAVGGANNQLAMPKHGAVLANAGVAYVPDFVANAGGVISIAREAFGFSNEQAARLVDQTFDRVHDVFAIAASHGITTLEAAERMALDRLGASRPVSAV